MRQNIILLLGSLFMLFLLGEVVIRLYHKTSRQIPFLANLYTYTDDSLGWKSKNFTHTLASGKYKIMVLGDSFSEGLGLAEDKIWHGYLSKKLNAQVFAYAGLGFGTLQEYMLIDRYFDEVKPDLIILQVCSNDLINNSLTLEKQSFHQNALHSRPYLINEKIQYHFPATFGFLGEFIKPNSRVIFYFGRQLQILLAVLARHGWIESIENKIAQDGIKMQALSDAVNTSARTIALIKQRVGTIPLLAFIVDTPQPNSNLLKNIFIGQGIQFSEQVAKEIQNGKDAGRNLTMQDKVHWNEAGHALAGETLINEVLLYKKSWPTSSYPE